VKTEDKTSYWDRFQLIDAESESGSDIEDDMFVSANNERQEDVEMKDEIEDIDSDAESEQFAQM